MEADEFCKRFPVVESKRAIALSVDDAGQSTLPVPIPAGSCAPGTFQVASREAYPLATPFSLVDCLASRAV